MDPAPSLGCSLKDVKWSSVAVPLDLLVSTYRLPQIARLDSAVGGLRFVFLKKILIHLKVSATLQNLNPAFQKVLQTLRAWSQEMWDLSFPTRDRTYTHCVGRGSLNHWTTSEDSFC
ncbi:hypothetical protein MJG53_015939 [Ovis ammon polii x Ovis aries]|uniref:Uncharacterized protein n=1 Tax=Ovis ammon polii x Ovis aries TaxID=2918886 RepID=A0ACB9UD12_9CETA|nr:hypothetical protein MJG53_015939 [Ovis ammon polii x Ovis aries]